MNTNIYFDVSCNSWVLEIESVSGWYVFGYYATKQNAEMMI